MNIKTIVTGELFTNTYILTDEASGKALVVDPAKYTQELAAAVDAVGRENVEYILLTHCHFDHILGVCALQKQTGAKVVICSPDDIGLGDTFINGADGFGYPCTALPKADIVVKDGDKINLGSLEITVMHTPGHTQGSCCYICDDVIFCGDTVFAYGGYGRTDLPGGSMKMLSQSINKLFALEGDYRLLPGHDVESTLQRERMCR